MLSEKVGIYIGRFNPPHLGHCSVIDRMLEVYGEDHIVFIGSANTKQSFRHFFSYSERYLLLKRMYPHLRIVGMPDIPGNDEEWLALLRSHIEAIHGGIMDIPRRGWEDKGTDVGGVKGDFQAQFFAGCEEEVRYLTKRNYEVEIHNRFTNVLVSSTEIRDCLVHSRSLQNKVDSRIAHDVQKMFITKWESFKNV